MKNPHFRTTPADCLPASACRFGLMPSAAAKKHSIVRTALDRFVDHSTNLDIHGHNRPDGYFPDSATTWQSNQYQEPERPRPLMLARPLYAALSMPAQIMKGFTRGTSIDSALILLNASGVVLCVALITAAVSSDEPARVAEVSETVKLGLRLLVAGAALPTVAWGILAFEFDRSHSKKKLLESMIVYIVLIISLIMFVIAGWRLPQAFITGLQISE
jgi:hypothetical protein